MNDLENLTVEQYHEEVISKILDDIIIDGIKNVGSKYFLIEHLGSEEPFLRERVFCYELYYQMRKIQSENKIEELFTINAEIDKRGYNLFDGENPDFIFHTQKTDRNLVVVEVKCSLRQDKSKNGKFFNIEKDFYNLLKFVNEHNYLKGVFILFGFSFEELMEKYQVSIKTMLGDSDKICCITIDKNREMFNTKNLNEWFKSNHAI